MGQQSELTATRNSTPQNTMLRGTPETQTNRQAIKQRQERFVSLPRPSARLPVKSLTVTLSELRHKRGKMSLWMKYGARQRVGWSSIEVQSRSAQVSVAMGRYQSNTETSSKNPGDKSTRKEQRATAVIQRTPPSWTKATPTATLTCWRRGARRPRRRRRRRRARRPSAEPERKECNQDTDRA